MIVGCPNCEARLRVNESARGKAIRCPKCGTVIRIASAGVAGSGEVAKAGAELPRASAKPVVVAVSVQPKQPPASDSTAPRKLKRKKTKSRSFLMPTLIVVGIVVGIVALGGGIFCVWYFVGQSTPDKCISEFLDILEVYADAADKADNPSTRSEAVSQINDAADRLERWINTYKDCEWSKEEVVAVEQKYRLRGEQVGQKLVRAAIKLGLRLDLRQDPALEAAVERFGKVAEGMHKMRMANRMTGLRRDQESKPQQPIFPVAPRPESQPPGPFSSGPNSFGTPPGY